MLRYLIELLGVDYSQWSVLTCTMLKLDMRMASLGQSRYRQSGKSDSSMRMWISRLLIYLFMGCVISPIVFVNKDVFLTGTFFLTYTMVMTAMLVLIDFTAVVISPDDCAILGYQPVSSRTYFITRLTNVLVYSTMLTLALGLVPILLYFFTRGFNPLLGIAALAAALMSGTSVALLLVLLYAAILRLVHPNKLRRALTYVQFGMSFIIYGGYMFVPRMIDAGTIRTAKLEKSLWLFLHPATWFASYLDLAVGHFGAAEIGPALFSVVALGLLLYCARGKLALEYSDHLSSAAAMSEGPKRISAAVSRPALIFKGNEARAVVLLVRNQFKYDQKFRMAVLSILPLTAIYLFMGLREGSLLDPFVSHGEGFSRSWLLYLAVLMFPTMLKTTLTNCDSYQASWIYYSAPADCGRLVLWSKNFVFVYFVLPYLLFIGAVFLYFYQNLWHVMIHVGVLGLLSHLFLQMAVFLNPALPFSQPARKGQRSGSFIATLMFGPIAAIGLLYALSVWIYPNTPVLVVVVVSLAGLSWLLEMALQARVRRRSALLEYHE